MMKFYFRSVARKSHRSIPVSDALESSIIQLTSGRIWRAEIESFGLALAREFAADRTGEPGRDPPRGSQNFVIKSRAIVNCFRVFDRKQPHWRSNLLGHDGRPARRSVPFPLAGLLNFLTFIRNAKFCVSIPGIFSPRNGNRKRLVKSMKVDGRIAVTLLTPAISPPPPFDQT